MIKNFIKLNRSYCRHLEKNFPNFFGNTENYNNDLKQMIVGYIKKNSPKNILEAGGIDRPILQKSNDYFYFGSLSFHLLEIEFDNIAGDF